MEAFASTASEFLAPPGFVFFSLHLLSVRAFLFLGFYGGHTSPLASSRSILQVIGLIRTARLKGLLSIEGQDEDLHAGGGTFACSVCSSCGGANAQYVRSNLHMDMTY